MSNQFNYLLMLFEALSSSIVILVEAQRVSVSIILGGFYRDLELPVASSGHGDLVLPHVEVQGVEIVLKKRLRSSND